MSEHQVNAERGEVAIVLDGKSYPMRPSFEAMQAIERGTGSALPELVHKMIRRPCGLSLSDMALIVTETVRAAGKDRDDKMLQAWEPARVGELIYSGGWPKALEAIEKLLINACNGGAAPKPGKKAEGTESESSIGA